MSHSEPDWGVQRTSALTVLAQECRQLMAPTRFLLGLLPGEESCKVMTLSH